MVARAPLLSPYGLAEKAESERERKRESKNDGGVAKREREKKFRREIRAAILTAFYCLCWKLSLSLSLVHARRHQGSARRFARWLLADRRFPRIRKDAETSLPRQGIPTCALLDKLINEVISNLINIPRYNIGSAQALMPRAKATNVNYKVLIFMKQYTRDITVKLTSRDCLYKCK